MRVEPSGEPEATEAAPKGRGVAPAGKPSKAASPKATKKVKGRTIYIADELWERIIVQSHRKDLNYSDYVGNLLERHVPDHRRVGPAASQVDQSEGEAS